MQVVSCHVAAHVRLHVYMEPQEVKHGNGYRLCKVKGGFQSVFEKQNCSSCLVNQVPQNHEQGPAFVLYDELSLGAAGDKP